MLNFIALDPALTLYYVIDLVIAVALLAALRLLSGVVASVSSRDELAERDNPAFGISLAGAAVAIAIILMGIISRSAGKNPGHETALVLWYGVLGIGSMWVTRKLFDHWSLPHMSTHLEIMQRNTAAGIVDAGNMIATAIILRAIIRWVADDTIIGLAEVLAGFVLSQLVLLAASWYRRVTFARRNNDFDLDAQIQGGNIAEALSFVGHRIGIALAVTAASGSVFYAGVNILRENFLWWVMAVIFALLLKLIAVIALKAILPGVDIAKEIDKQSNVAIGTLDAAVYVGVGFLLVGLFG